MIERIFERTASVATTVRRFLWHPWGGRIRVIWLIALPLNFGLWIIDGAERDLGYLFLRLSTVAMVLDSINLRVVASRANKSKSKK